MENQCVSRQESRGKDNGESENTGLEIPHAIEGSCNHPPLLQGNTHCKTQTSPYETGDIAGLATKVTDPQWLTFIDQFAIICLQETWVKDAIHINGFQTLNTPAIESKQGRNKGGLCIYISNTMGPREVKYFYVSDYFQILTIGPGNKSILLLINFYNNVPRDQIKQVLLDMPTRVKLIADKIRRDIPIIWVGDFNCSICRCAHLGTCDIGNHKDDAATHFTHTVSGELLNDMLAQLDLGYANELSKRPASFKPTFIGRGCNSVIDFVLISQRYSSIAVLCDTLNVAMSDHYPISLDINLPGLMELTSNTTLYNFKTNLASLNGYSLKWAKVDGATFYEQLIKKSMGDFEICLSQVREDAEIFEAFIEISKQVKGLLTKKPRKGEIKEHGWFDRECSRDHSQLLKILHSKTENKAEVVKARSVYRLALKKRKLQIKREAWEALHQASIKNDTAGFWKAVNAPFLASRDRDITDVAIPEEKWVEHFKGLYNDGQSDGHRLIMDKILIQPTPDSAFPMDIEFTLEEVNRAISESAAGKAPGPDGVPVDIYKSNTSLWAPLLTNVLNSFKRYRFPPTWAEATLVPIFKKGDRNDPRCYRPISLLDAFMKVAGRVILNKLQVWIEEKDILSKFQYGFRAGLGTIEQGLNLSLIIEKYVVAKEGNLFLTFVDLSSAFDCVIHAKLWTVLEDMGVDPPRYPLYRNCTEMQGLGFDMGRMGNVPESLRSKKG